MINMTGRYYQYKPKNNANYHDKTGYSSLFLNGSNMKNNNNFYYKKEFKSSKWFGQIVTFRQIF